jgi:hypothetical protein
MKFRTLVILAVVFAVLIGFSVWTSREPASSLSVEPVGSITALEGFDANQVAEMNIEAPSGTNVLVKQNKKWVVASLFNYPAHFERIVECLRSLSDLKSGQVVRGGTEHLDEVGLAQGQVTQIRLKDSSGKILASLALGAMRSSRAGGPYGGFPQGQYFRVGEGRVPLCYRAIRCRHFSGPTKSGFSVICGQFPRKTSPKYPSPPLRALSPSDSLLQAIFKSSASAQMSRWMSSKLGDLCVCSKRDWCIL